MPEFNDQKCPRGRSTLITNGRRVSCSFVGGRTKSLCSFGLDTPAFVGSFPPRSVPPDRAAFQATILDQPADDTARLAYSEHLRESDDEFDQVLAGGRSTSCRSVGAGSGSARACRCVQSDREYLIP
ncbi:unnamed protein product [Gemmata massiliana]|uniref:Uncharacterized protein n=1 Tax=Gemmata massiliana TaxID=1210884 RepID=A0A6P2DER8_9BACT|nr:unnamed protein product [Gemmata massiliana]